MTFLTHYIIFPDGEAQEIPGPVPFNGLVDLNGRPLPPHLPTTRMIVYRVTRISTRETPGETRRLYNLELVTVEELENSLE